jgi:2'-5' RNA ligase
VDVSPPVRQALAELQGRLRKAAPAADVRWVRPESVHLTLKFLGEVAEERVGAVERALAEAVVGHHPLGLVARGAGGFPTGRRPRVVWAGVEGDVDTLGRLAADVERTVAPLGWPTEARPFAAHLTLGRVRVPKRGPLGDAIEAAAGVELGAWAVGEVVLYRSRLRPTGAVYEPIARLVLAG